MFLCEWKLAIQLFFQIIYCYKVADVNARVLRLYIDKKYRTDKSWKDMSPLKRLANNHSGESTKKMKSVIMKFFLFGFDSLMLR